ncbi:MAG TPA: bifunctional riboflavin kinase/FAD synthetase [Eubacteriaceae bacterium]|nr:bifunctional riboflavin kinase/FAD synthetase [Eubacteriaceae bacterium]
MQIIEKYIDNHKETDQMVIALGYFDGIHLGHQKLIKRAKKIAETKNLKSAVFTFKSHPLSILAPERVPRLIYSNSKKIKIIQSLGIDYLIFPEFSNELMLTKAEDFVKDILVDKFNMKHAVIGFNYKFGYKESGTPQTLIDLGKKYGFEVTIIEAVKADGITISSTNIRKQIQKGEMETAKNFLGCYYSISGKVVKGKGLGKKLSIPTANINIDNKIVLPKNGVYKTIVKIEDNKYKAITNIGLNPTFENHPYSIETYILDFNQDIYGIDIEIYFLKRIRGERKFNTLEELVNQIQKDIEIAKK